MKCKNASKGTLCGAEISPTAKFCSTCGQAVEREEVKSALCPKCGKTVKQTEKFCSECGLKIDPHLFQPIQCICKVIIDEQMCGANLSSADMFCKQCGSATGFSRESHLSSSDDIQSDNASANIKLKTSYGIEKANEKEINQVVESDQTEHVSDTEMKTDEGIAKPIGKSAESIKISDKDNKQESRSDAEYKTAEGSTGTSDEEHVKGTTSKDKNRNVSKSKHKKKSKIPKKKGEQPNSEEGTSKEEIPAPSKSKLKKRSKVLEKTGENSNDERSFDPGSRVENDGINSDDKSREKRRNSDDEQRLMTEKPSDAGRTSGDENVDSDGKSCEKRGVSDEELQSVQEETTNAADVNEGSSVDIEGNLEKWKSDKEKDKMQKKTSNAEDVNEGSSVDIEGNSEAKKWKSDNEKDKMQKETAYKEDKQYSGSGERLKTNNVKGEKRTSTTDKTQTNPRDKRGKELPEAQVKSKEDVKVCFHVIVSPALVPSGGKLAIVFENDQKRHMNVTGVLHKDLNSGSEYAEYKGTYLFTLHQNIMTRRYAYYDVTSTNEVKEYIQSSQFRTLQLLANTKTECIYQYDGFARSKNEKEKKKWPIPKFLASMAGFEYTNSFVEILKNDAQIAIGAFLPQLQFYETNSTAVIGEQMCARVKKIWDDTKKHYIVNQRAWSSEKDFETQALKFLQDPVDRWLERLLEYKRISQREEDTKLHVLCAVTIILLLKEHNLCFSSQQITNLCDLCLPFLTENQKRCYDFEKVRDHFGLNIEMLQEALLWFIKDIASKGEETCWLKCIPLFHFISGKSTPFKLVPPDLNHADRNPTWWGITDFHAELETFKTSHWNRSPNDLIEALKPYFEIDFLLPRALLASMNFPRILDVDLSKVRPEIAFAVLNFYIKSSPLSKKSVEDYIKLFYKMVSSMRCLNERYNTHEDAQRSFWIVKDLLETCLAKTLTSTATETDKNDLVIALSGVVFHSVHFLLKTIDQNCKKEDYFSHFDELKVLICDRVKNVQNDDLRSTIERWNHVIQVDIPDGRLKTEYSKYVKEKWQTFLNRLTNEREKQLIDIYCNDFESFDKTLQDIVAKYTYQAIQKHKSVVMSPEAQKVYKEILPSVFERNLDISNLKDGHQCLKYSLTWPPFATFLELFNDQQFSSSLNDNCQKWLNKFIDVLKAVCDGLCDGTVSINDLKLILKNEDNFRSVVHQLHDVTIENFESIIQMRKKEIEKYYYVVKCVEQFNPMCVDYLDNVDILEEKHTDNASMEQIKLNDVCKIQGADQISINTYEPTILAFEISENWLDMLPLILNYNTSFLFQKIWKKTGDNLLTNTKKGLSINEIFFNIWQPTYERWESLQKKLKSGHIKLSEYNEYFQNTQRTELQQELKFFEENIDETEWIEHRLAQFDQFKYVHSCLSAAKLIHDVVTIYGITGNFQEIKEVIDLAADTEAFCKETKAKTGVYKSLSSLDYRQEDCLKAFIECKDLVVWIRETMKSGLEELKVFVDLASISAGEGDVEIDKVNRLQEAVSGYSPLIFIDLKTEINTLNLLEQCQDLWENLSANEDLPTKLRATNLQLEWFKIIKQSHGSVEVTSLFQAEKINSNGIYVVGNNSKHGISKKPTLADVLSLKVYDKSATSQGILGKNKSYNYDQLHDLQSRLMLVAGKAEQGKEDINRFLMILDSVVRLAHIYIKLVSKGCVLFSQWHVKIFCDRERHACLVVSFGHGQNKTILKGKIEQHEDVSTIVPLLAKFMEESHEEWLKHIDDKRDRFYFLNYFSIDQMVFLQQELVKMGSTEPSVLIYPLLSAIEEDCNQDDLQLAMTKAKEKIGTVSDSSDDDDETQTHVLTKKEIIYSGEELKFIERMESAGFPKDLAGMALTHVNSAKDKVEGINWCMENRDKTSSNEKHTEAENDQFQGTTFKSWTSTKESLATVTAQLVQQTGGDTRDNAFKWLITALGKIWESFLKTVSSSVSDYLSVEHLGCILKSLSEQETSPMKCKVLPVKVSRELLPGFRSGEPNVIVCPQRDVYNAALSMYIYDPKSPLPQPDEVLLCSRETTLDQFEIFIRRALYSNEAKTYCILNADLLDYDVCEKGTAFLEDHMKIVEKKKSYRLIIIVSNENEYKSGIVAALDKFRRQIFISESNDIKSYLRDKFRIQNSPQGVSPASVVDSHRSSVRVIRSSRGGVGKTLYASRMVDKLKEQMPNIDRTKPISVVIRLHEKKVEIDKMAESLLIETLPPKCYEPRIFHLDISHEVHEGVDSVLFQLLILGSIESNSGQIWRKSPLDYYIIEIMPPIVKHTESQGDDFCFLHHCLDILPTIECKSPTETYKILNSEEMAIERPNTEILFDDIEFQSETFQRPYQYLKRHDSKSKLDDVDPTKPEDNHKECLRILLRHCGLNDPSWSEIYHFVSFLDKQLQDFERSSFCGDAAREALPGFAKFVLKFLIQMSKDFATRSLKLSEESPLTILEKQISNIDGEKLQDVNQEDELIQLYQMRRTWETSPHPYIFFNPDESMTFVGFYIDVRGNLRDLKSDIILEERIMTHELRQALVTNKVNLSEHFESLKRKEKLTKICTIMGVKYHDPDETYELTTDNVKKILAIYMRFKCEIPVVIMGETGCGKTSLIKFMCALQRPIGVNDKNMVLMKVHGGTKASDIVRIVRKAEKIADLNSQNHKGMFTILFFDEANTTEAIGVIKEIMCDKCIEGRPIKLHANLKIVAACNPYRKHSDELIRRLEQSGLGYHVDANNTTDTLGRVPMRRLVYRVQPLPQSLLPLVWDFGQLDKEVEEMYIVQMVTRYVKEKDLQNLIGYTTVISTILTASQEYMRNQKDECSFVSLRDVERVLDVMFWFFNQCVNNKPLFQIIKEREMDTKSDISAENSNSSRESSDLSSDNDEECEGLVEKKTFIQVLDDVTRCLVLALGVCYHASLKDRKAYREEIAGYFKPPLHLPVGPDDIEQEIHRCQTVFLENIQLAPNIARNQALKENVFIMIVCIELRIPLFLVGKPGSSKSLAKFIIADAMQGRSSKNDFFKDYKQVQMMSFQCSPISVPEGIVSTFRQCAAYQKDKILDNFVSVVVLDEIGLAEDSPRMPLKTLHPLLETGSADDETVDPYKKVGFIGISNWALDPAKMNRGIFVQRDVPTIQELEDSAIGICSTDNTVKDYIRRLIPKLALSYIDVFDAASSTMREFFGLRDFYSLIKMLYGFAKRSRHKPTQNQLIHSVLRNFGGLESVNPVEIFQKRIGDKHLCSEKTDDPDCTSAGMIKACLTGSTDSSVDNRYLLLLTENYGALSILQQKQFKLHKAVTIFGSSFPNDQEYTQICRNINCIKVCMETGTTVILLNLENLYESLYDALNQYYFELGGVRYVDLGLGTHRVKCRVSPEFRLIVVAEKSIVYDKFPIPLINRLEKHFLSTQTLLTENQIESTHRLQNWAEKFIKSKHERDTDGKILEKRNVGDCFIGFNKDTCATIILHTWKKTDDNDVYISSVKEKLLRDAKSALLWCAIPSVVLQHGESDEFQIYFREQHHESLADYLNNEIKGSSSSYVQVTTNSKLLVESDVDELCRVCTDMSIAKKNTSLLTLHLFDTEQQFCMKIRSCIEHEMFPNFLLIVQCECGEKNADLIACARYVVQGEIQQMQKMYVHVVFLIQLPGISSGSFTGFQCGQWQSVHIDDLFPASKGMPALIDMCNKSLNELLVSTVPRNSLGGVGLQNPRPCMDLNQILINCIQPALAKIQDPADDLPRRTDRLRILHNILQHYQHDSAARDKDDKDDKAKTTETTENRDSKTTARDNNDKAETTENKDYKTTAHDNEHDDDQAETTEKKENKTRMEMLLSGISKHVIKLLNEKEEKSGRRMSPKWLFSEAEKLETGNKAGTFRKLIIQYLEAKVIPIMAKVIAFIDTNRNLDILVRYDCHTWQIKLFFETLNLAKLEHLNFSSLLIQELKITKIKTTSLLGNTFNAYIPFSWILYEQTERLLKTQLDEKDIKENIRKTVDVLKSTEIGSLVDKLDARNINQFMCDYIKDFARMAHPLKSEEEHQLICETIKAGYTFFDDEDDDYTPLTTVCRCHLIFKINEARFNHLSLVVSVFPNCCQDICEMKKKQPKFELVTDKEMTLDVFALHILLQKLEIQKGVLEDLTTRRQWLRNVCDYRLIVDIMFSHLKQSIVTNHHGYGEQCRKGLLTIRYHWTKVLILKLFVDLVCNGSPIQETELKNCLPFWVILGPKADMKTIETFNDVECFLKGRNKAVLKDYFGQMAECLSCDKPIESVPVTLPCVTDGTRHVVCQACLNQIKEFEEYECPKCGREFPADFDPKTAENRVQIANYQDFRTRINKFFMEVVSQLSFIDGSFPCPEILEKIMSYVTGSDESKSAKREVTKELTVFHDSIDPTPVVRSFLLQQMMLMSGEEWKKHLSTYFQKTSELVEEHGSAEKLKLCMLVLFCMEDSMYQQFSKVNENLIDNATRLADEVLCEIGTEQSLLSKIKNICNTRFTLYVTANILHGLYTSRFPEISEQQRCLFDSAGRLCDKSDSEWPRRYFVKHLCRTNGIDSYQRILTESDEEYLTWVCLKDMKDEKLQECPDRYVVCGEEYKHFGEELRKIVTLPDIDDLSKQIIDLTKCAGNWSRRIKMLLAFYRQITLQHIYPEPVCNKETKAVIIETVENQQTIKNKDLLRDIVQNQVWGSDSDLNIFEGMNISQQNIACLLTHYLSVMSEIPGQTTLVTPLVEVALRPENMTNTFLPTMPQDDIEEIEQAIKGAACFYENPTFYKCPNGHRYVIGDCGKAFVKQRCNVCNEVIGGVLHILEENNIQDDGQDTTETGHILGQADESCVVTVPERYLNRACFSVVRLLLHLSMFIGTKFDSRAILQFINPSIEANEVCGYILAHIKLDLQSIQKVLGKSNDEVYLLIHFILADIVNKHTMNVIGENCEQNMCGLTDKKGRAQWEREFVGRYISPVLEDIESILDSCNQKLVNDKRLGFNALLRVIYETDECTEVRNTDDLEHHPAPWKYRREITIDLFAQMLNASKEDCPTLTYFFQEEHHLRAIRFVPSILRLHKLLLQKYNRQLDRGDADGMNVSEVRQQMKEERRYEDFDHLLEDYKEAWQYIRQSLDNFPLLVKGNIVKLKKELCRVQIDDNTSICYLLPTYKGSGLISFAMLYFLLDKQNTFLQHLSYDNLPEVSIRDISQAHLICYHPEKDLLPMALASCNYSFEMGKDAQTDYNFKDLERQIMDKFLFSKSKIKITEIETFVYRAEATNGVVFKTLSARIAQVRLKPSVKAQIINEIRQKTLPVICESLDNLDVAINYINSVGSDSEAKLNEFMVSILKMENPLPSQKAEQTSKFKHTMSLWIILALERARRLSTYNKDSFEWVSDNLKEPLTTKESNIKTLLDQLPIEHLNNFVELLFECIVLRMDIPENMDDDDFYDSSRVSLRDTLIGYIDATPYDEEFKIEDTLMTTITKFPSEKNTSEIVLTANAVAVWNLVNSVYEERTNQGH